MWILASINILALLIVIGAVIYMFCVLADIVSELESIKKNIKAIHLKDEQEDS